MIDDFFKAQKQAGVTTSQEKLNETSKHYTEQLKDTSADHEFEDMDMESNYSDDNALLKSSRQDSDRNLLMESMQSEAGQPEFFQSKAQEQLKEDLKTAQNMQI